MTRFLPVLKSLEGEISPTEASKGHIPLGSLNQATKMKDKKGSLIYFLVNTHMGLGWVGEGGESSAELTIEEPAPS